jgi:hypothetical protein
MIVSVDSWIARLWMKLPRRIGRIYFVRFENQYTNRVKIDFFTLG